VVFSGGELLHHMPSVEKECMCVLRISVSKRIVQPAMCRCDGRNGLSSAGRASHAAEMAGFADHETRDKSQEPRGPDGIVRPGLDRA
jgi:hypothetical protein